VLSCTQPPGHVAAGGDCNDASGNVNPGAVDVCGDGIDNDCDGIADDGGPLTAASGMTVTDAGGGTVAWTPLAGANGYDVVRGSLATLAASHGDFSLATSACLADNVNLTSLTDGGVPAAGSGVWYLVRGENCGGAGTYDSGAASQAGSRDA